METMIDLKDLLKHEIMDLYSAEEQIIEALPAMIEKAENSNLKKALQEHLKITKEQKNRLDKVQQFMGEGEQTEDSGSENKGFFSRIFSSGGNEKCKAMEGLIEEGQKLMDADMSPEALNAAIIGAAQKIEHYEISGYGTARAYARELKLKEVEQLLEQTLNEEYEADDRLTKLAVRRINIEAEQAKEEDTAGTAQHTANSSHKSTQERKQAPGKSGEGKSGAKQTKSQNEKKKTSSSGSDNSKKSNSSTKANSSRSGSSNGKAGTKSNSNGHKKNTSKKSSGNTKRSTAKSGSRSK